MVKDSPIYQAIGAWFEQMPTTMELELVASFKRLRQRYDGVIRVGALYAGSDVQSCFMDALSLYISSMYKIILNFEMIYQVESNPKKQKHLLDHTKQQFLFSHVSDLLEDYALDLKSNEKVLVPHVNLMTAGPPCISRTPLNSTSSQNVNCVRAGLSGGEGGATGTGFAETMELSVLNKPDCVIWENVTPLEEKKGELPSDSDFIVESYNKKCGQMICLKPQASDYGSLADRLRLFFVGFEGKRGKGQNKGKVNTLMRSVLAGCTIGRLPADRFLMLDPVELGAWRSLVAPHSEPLTKSPKGDALLQWKEEHMVFYKHMKLSWPWRPLPHSSEAERYGLLTTAESSLSERGVGAIILLDKMFESKASVEFCDVNPSLAWILKNKHTEVLPVFKK
jgi:hypothetical protein